MLHDSLPLLPNGVKRPAAGFPLIVHVHGGGWMLGDSHLSGPFVDFPGALASPSARGYVVASIDYRLSGEAAFPAPIQDVKAAIRWLRSRATDYGIDPARAMTWGESAGGHLAGLAAVSCGAQDLEPAQTIKIASADTAPDVITSSKISDCVQGGVTWAGVFDIVTIAAQAREEGAMSRDVADANISRLGRPAMPRTSLRIDSECATHRTKGQRTNPDAISAIRPNFRLSA
jgi:alpha/beta hydrolase fold